MTQQGASLGAEFPVLSSELSDVQVCAFAGRLVSFDQGRKTDDEETRNTSHSLHAGSRDLFRAGRSEFYSWHAVKSIDKGTKTVVVKTADGTEHT